MMQVHCVCLRVSLVLLSGMFCATGLPAFAAGDKLGNLKKPTPVQLKFDKQQALARKEVNLAAKHVMAICEGALRVKNESGAKPQFYSGFCINAQGLAVLAGKDISPIGGVVYNTVHNQYLSIERMMRAYSAQGGEGFTPATLASCNGAFEQCVVGCAVRFGFGCQCGTRFSVCLTDAIAKRGVAAAPPAEPLWLRQLKWVETADPVQDAEKDFSTLNRPGLKAVGDPWVIPGVPDSLKHKYESTYGIRFINHTEKVLEDERHKRLVRMAYDYAKRFNLHLLQLKGVTEATLAQEARQAEIEQAEAEAKKKAAAASMPKRLAGAEAMRQAAQLEAKYAVEKTEFVCQALSPTPTGNFTDQEQFAMNYICKKLTSIAKKERQAAERATEIYHAHNSMGRQAAKVLEMHGAGPDAMTRCGEQWQQCKQGCEFEAGGFGCYCNTDFAVCLAAGGR